MIVIAILAVAAAATSVWRVHCLKKEIYAFEERVENALDDIISGKGYEEEAEHAKDSLWGRCSEKLWRVNRIWTQKEEANLREKKQMKELISDISHQTKTPVANIKLYLEFLQEEELTPRGREFAEHLEGQTKKIEFLLQSMVKMSRLETGIIQIRKQQRRLYETIAEAASQIVPSAAKKQIELSVDCEEETEVRHDRKWTEEAIFNVLDNAVKYTGQGGRIHIRVRCQEVFTKISVQDSGKGIAPDRQAQIFSRFYREPEVHDQSGIGIGLYLARRILELQDGYIEVRSQMGEGSEFCLYLPN